MSVTEASGEPAAGRTTVAVDPFTVTAGLFERQVMATPEELAGRAKSAVASVGIVTDATARSIASEE
ncbi:hypothetical protein Q0F99_06220 [Rathayibacter oskolensis]|nr:hypothetical protein [Rathayibacter oskolensis]WKK72535.1 hypothetical protein Q0F99_06220 [Rathayibacter oskolensis]